MGAQRKIRGGGKNRLQNWDESEFEAYGDAEPVAYAGYVGSQGGNLQSAKPEGYRSTPRSTSLRSESRQSSSAGSMQGGRSW